MKETLENICGKLHDNLYKNEEHVRLSLVSRILQKLGWYIWNPDEVFCEFPVAPSEDMTKIDIALFFRQNTPAVFIEIKSVGKMEANLSNIEQQLRDYNRNNTAMFSVITDGRLWRFYYSQTGGEFSSKCFKSFDILNDNINDLELFFDAFLSKNEIVDGNAEREAKKYLEQTQIERTVAEALPEALREVNKQPYPRLPEAVVQLVTSRGFQITEHEAEIIIEKLDTKKISSEKQIVDDGKNTSNKTKQKNNEIYVAGDYSYKKINSFVFRGKTYQRQPGKIKIPFKGMLIIVLTDIYKSHPDKFDECLIIKGRTRDYFSKNMDDLYSPKQIDNAGYYVETNLSANDIVKLLKDVMRLFEYKESDLKIFTY